MRYAEVEMRVVVMDNSQELMRAVKVYGLKLPASVNANTLRGVVLKHISGQKSDEESPYVPSEAPTTKLGAKPQTTQRVVLTPEEVDEALKEEEPLRGIRGLMDKVGFDDPLDVLVLLWGIIQEIRNRRYIDPDELEKEIKPIRTAIEELTQLLSAARFQKIVDDNLEKRGEHLGEDRVSEIVSGILKNLQSSVKSSSKDDWRLLKKTWAWVRENF